ncbi:MAG: class I SAM-dependent methyltransferase [Gammaproteobacteria bacterium]
MRTSSSKIIKPTPVSERPLPSNLVAVTCSVAEENLQQAARQLAERLKLPYCTQLSEDYRYFLTVTPDKLILQMPTSAHKPVCVDFLSAPLQHRLRFGGGELIAKAVGVKPQHKLSVLDLTAGFGTDGFILAQLGCQVQWVERSPLIAALLEDGLRRLHQVNPSLSLQLIVDDAQIYLSQLPGTQRPDVIYLDPMFPERKKTALNKLSMRILQDLVGEDTDAAQLLPLALRCAKSRVVVKRPKLAEPLNHQQPDLVLSGKSGRFDVYLAGKLPALPDSSHDRA